MHFVFCSVGEITRLSKLPLGFRLGPVYQIIDVPINRFCNRAFVRHKFRASTANVLVLASFDAKPPRRLYVDFERNIFTVTSLFFLPLALKRVITPRNNFGGRRPSLDLTFLDDEVRIGRGGDGSLFVLKKVNDLNSGRKRWGLRSRLSSWWSRRRNKGDGSQ